MFIITLFNTLIYYKIISYWITNIFYRIISYTDYLVLSELYDFDNSFYIDNKNNILLINFILYLLSFDTNIYYLILVSVYFVNIIEFYIKIRLYGYVLNISFYLLVLCLHIIMIYFFFDNTSYMSPIIYMTSCFIIGYIID
jgi:hypothetical protein